MEWKGARTDFSFAPGPGTRSCYPLTAIKPIYTMYACSYGDVGSVYQDDAGNTIVLLKDPLDTPVERFVKELES